MDASVPIFLKMAGPLGRDVLPAGEDTFEDLVNEYRTQFEGVNGPVHINCMLTMAESRAAILAAGECGCGPVWVSWGCDEEGESPARVHILAALFVAEGMGAAAFGLNCPAELADEKLKELAAYASIPLFYVVDGVPVLWDYEPVPRDPDVIPCAVGTQACFVTRTVDVGEELECTPDLLEDIIDAEDDPVGAVKIAILEQDDVDIFAQEQYAVDKALCLWSDVPELLEGALRVFQGRAFYDGTGELEPQVLDALSKKYGLIIL